MLFHSMSAIACLFTSAVLLDLALRISSSNASVRANTPNIEASK